MIKYAPPVVLAASLSACTLWPVAERVDEKTAAGTAGPSAPINSQEFALASPGDSVLGRIQIVNSRYEDTFSDLARRYNLGYEELKAANPAVDPWLPGDGTRVMLPTAFVLPDAPREGIVLNVATMRLFYFPRAQPPALPKVITHPVGIGRVEWSTPVGTTAVIDKARDPVWYVPRSIRQEHAAAGDPLPAEVPPGPDNPLGEYVLGLGIPGYLIHGTNQPYGVGMRVSHGCVRLYPEDIAPIYEDVSVGTPVHIVNQPYLAAWRDGMLYLEAHRPLEEDERDWLAGLERLLNNALERAGRQAVVIDRERVARVARDALGVPIPVMAGGVDPDQLIGTALLVENTLPPGSNLKQDPALQSATEDAPMLQTRAQD